jgi:hypothetical protein
MKQCPEGVPLVSFHESQELYSLTFHVVLVGSAALCRRHIDWLTVRRPQRKRDSEVTLVCEVCAGIMVSRESQRPYIAGRRECIEIRQNTAAGNTAK